MRRRVLLFICLLCLIMGGCIKPNYVTGLTIINESSYSVGWSLSGFEGEKNLRFEGERVCSKDGLIDLIKRKSGIDIPFFTFYLIEPELVQEIGKEAAKDCDIRFLGTGGEGLLRDYLEIYDFQFKISDNFICNIATANGVDLNGYTNRNDIQ